MPRSRNRFRVGLVFQRNKCKKMWLLPLLMPCEREHIISRRPTFTLWRPPIVPVLATLWKKSALGFGNNVIVYFSYVEYRVCSRLDKTNSVGHTSWYTLYYYCWTNLSQVCHFKRLGFEFRAMQEIKSHTQLQATL